MMRAGDYEQIINYDWPYYEACFISIIWNRLILQLAAQSLIRVFCSWPSCRGSVDWLVMQGVLLGRWCRLLLFSWCLHSGCLLWWFFFFLWRSGWSCLQNSTSLLFLQQLPSPLCYCDRQWLCSCDLIQFIVGYFMWPLDPNHLSQLSFMKTVQFSHFILCHTPGSAVVQEYTFH